MNERIKQLIDMATTVVEPDDPDYRHEHFDKVEFAELIIRECLAQVRDEVQYISDWDKADQVLGEVKKHFGVSDER